MSTPGDRQRDVELPPSRSRTTRLTVIGVLAVLLAVQVAYQVFFTDHTFADAERMKVLQNASVAKETPASAKHDWPQWRGPNRDGISAEKNLLTTWPAQGPAKLWEQPAGAGYAALAIAGGRAFTIMQDGDSEAVVCWDAASGKELWRYRYKASFISRDGSGPRSTPTVDGDLVYTVGGTGQMHCLKTHPATPEGEVVWHKDLLQEFGAENLRWGVSFSPLVEGNLIYINPGGPRGNSIAALDMRSGELKWKNLDDPAGYSSPIAAVIAGRRQIIFFTQLGLVGVSPDDGTLLWRFPWETSYGCNIATPVAFQDYVFLSSGYGRGCAVVHVEPAADGTLQAQRVYENNRMCNHFPSSVLYQGHLYGFNESRLTCMEFATGKVKWRESGFGKGSLLIAGGDLIILGDGGKLAMAQASPEAYREKASCQVSSAQCWVVPVLADGRLYVRDDRRVTCFDLRGEMKNEERKMKNEK
jgi:outer membrane protein assembly factor BamB